MEKKKIIGTFFEKNEKYILYRFPFLKKYKEEDRVKEFIVEAMAHVSTGLLKEKDNKNPKNKSNNELYNFVKEIFKLLK